jgi:hypothetical protein
LQEGLRRCKRIALLLNNLIPEWSDLMMNRRGNLKALASAAAIAAGSLTFAIQAQAQAGNTIKVGVLHSLSGTMAISETVL